MVDKIAIEIVHANQTLQRVINLDLIAGSTILHAIISANFISNDIDMSNIAVGIFGKRRNLDYVLQEGDRVEIYTPLLIDPKQARKERAKKSKQAKAKKRHKN